MILPQDLHGAYLITGPSGVGKTTVALALRGRGYTVEFNANVAHFVDDSGKEAAKPWDISDLEWLTAHRWVFNHDKLISLFKVHDTDHIFIEATSSDMDRYVSHFKGIFCLHLADSVLAARIQADSREGRYGKEDFQLKEIIDGTKNLEIWVKSVGGHVIDVDQPIDKVVDDILKEA